MAKIFNEKVLKSLYNILTVFLCACFITIACFGVYVFVTVKYVFPLSYKKQISEYADYYGLDKALIFAVVKTESNFNDNAVSKAGAVGLMQITEKTGNYIAKLMRVDNFDLKDANTNINFGCFYIKYLLLRFKHIDTALIAYNAGEGNVSLWLKNNEYSIDGITLKITPFYETNEYIKKIKENFSKYKKIYGKFLDKL